MSTSLQGRWALILGASSGFGAAAATRLAAEGMHICGVHLDRRGTLPQVDAVKREIAARGGEALFFNANAASDERRGEVVSAVAARLGPGRPREPIKVVLHSLAFGTLKPYVAPTPKEAITRAQMEMTLDVMASSLVYWVQDLLTAELLGAGSHIFAMTSAGDYRVWPSYGAVSAAKAALEANCRQLAVELAPRAIAVNALRAGVTDTPALRKIPGNEALIEQARARNPGARTTTPEDLADAIATLARTDGHWLTGNVIGVDGGEDIVG